MRFLSIVVIALCAAAVSKPAAADAILEGREGAWHIYAAVDDATNTFSGCIVAAPYVNGHILSFVVTSEYKWAMTLQNSRWSLPKGSVYSLSYAIDGELPNSVSGAALQTKMIAVPLDETEALFNRFRRGNTLVIKTYAGVRIPFSLASSHQALTAGLRCVMRYGARGRGTTSNPFGREAGTLQVNGTAKATAPRAEKAAAQAYKAEAVTVVANFLAIALKGEYRILSEEERARLAPDTDAAWVAASLFGALNVLPVGLDYDYQALAGALISRDSQACKGKFASTKGPLEKGYFMQMNTYCVDKNGNTEVRYFAVPRDKGGAYVFSLYKLPVEDKGGGDTRNFEALTASLTESTLFSGGKR
ncbi:hypothetical protein JDN40_08800 [Rhodomicrobium vannielii ATCC 17100]|uniref:hypothetical protein n=1 Tax=Rhodomicrobium vannielii TaxID=1069 RepID=UPI0019183DC0|nr:hypothetical protein [Rhodomicrobium vannielii]MBJ7534201.1 hypothetical protein [Rhodomicrobium vannielii ATCC 17100]